MQSIGDLSKFNQQQHLMHKLPKELKKISEIILSKGFDREISSQKIGEADNDENADEYNNEEDMKDFYENQNQNCEDQTEVTEKVTYKRLLTTSSSEEEVADINIIKQNNKKLEKGYSENIIIESSFEENPAEDEFLDVAIEIKKQEEMSPEQKKVYKIFNELIVVFND